ncbi:MAG: hypothetical protein AABW87_02300 [Nanoarchaeota archaeon]
MENKNFVIFGAIAVAVFILFVLVFPSSPESGAGAANTIGSYEQRTSNGAVSIDLTPLGLNGNNMEFKMGVNTHTVDLSNYDLTNLAVLVYDGNSVKPTSAPRLSGHHVSGVIAFPADRNIKNFKVVVKGIPDVNERVFEW